jgi:8-oxo-dGTP pyrophosphatase MutT (NUDIX family)
VRALLIDPADAVLLVAFEFPDADGYLWAAPGGGLEPGEDPISALRRELLEEVGLVGAEIGPPVWTRTHLFPFFDGSHEGQTETFYLVPTVRFEPRPSLGWPALRREYVADARWWTLGELGGAAARFAPRRLATALRRLLSEGPPPEPIDVGV